MRRLTNLSIMSYQSSDHPPNHFNALDPTEQKIFQAAYTLLDSHGEAFTMGMLEQTSKVSRATLYRRIGNKEALLRRIAEERGERFERVDVKPRILCAARTVFSREGFAAAAMEQVATEAAVGVATVYRHFGDKEGLVLSFIEELSSRTEVRKQMLQPSEDVRADLKNLLELVLPIFYENRDMFRLVMLGSESDRQFLKTLRSRSDSTFSRFTSYLKMQIKQNRLKTAMNPDDLALALMGMVMSFTIVGPLHYGRTLENIEDYSNIIVDLFLNGLESKS